MTKLHFQYHYLEAKNAGLDYLAAAVLALYERAFPEDFQ